MQAHPSATTPTQHHPNNHRTTARIIGVIYLAVMALLVVPAAHRKGADADAG
jgi:hypothetical protein